MNVKFYLAFFLFLAAAGGTLALADQTGANPSTQGSQPTYQPPPPPNQPPPGPPPGYPQQPYQQQPYPQQPYAQPYSPPPSYQPGPPPGAPYGPFGPIGRPPITDGQYLAGGMVGTFVGLGIGNAIQGRYLPHGLYYTIGEALGYGFLISAANDCNNVYNGFGQAISSCDSNLEWAGLSLVIALKIWEMIDVWSYPHQPASPAYTRYSFWAAPVTTVAQNASTTAMEAGVGIHF